MLELLFRKRRGLLLIVLLGITAGIMLAARIPVKLYPNTRKPVISVFISHQGFTAVDFHDQFSTLLESRLSGIEDVEVIEASYSNGRTRFRVEFAWEVDYEEALQRTDSAMTGLRNSLPEDSRDYSVRSWAGENAGFLAVGVSSPDMKPKDLFLLLESVLEPKLSGIEDAESIEMVNIEELRATVTLDPNTLVENGLTPDQVLSSVRSGYKPEPIGSFDGVGGRFNIRLVKGIDSLYDIGRITVARIEGRTLRLEDVADIDIRYDLPRTLFRTNGNRAIMIFATPKENGNIKQMSSDIKEIIEATRAELPADVEFHYLVDPALFIDRAIKSVIKAALIGASLAILCVLILLGEVRNTMLIAFSIPLSVGLSFILMYLFDLTINLISLGGMTLSVGMIIDSSIVVMENIHRHRLEDLASGNRRNLKTVIIGSIKEVRVSVFASTLTSVLVFLPLSFTAPLANAILGDLARVVVYTLSSSLLVALFITPVAAYYLFRREHAKGIVRSGLLVRMSRGLMGRLRKLYLGALRRLTASGFASVMFILLSFGLLAFAVLRLGPNIKTEILAQPESDKINFFLRNHTIEDKELMLEAIAPVEQELLSEYPGVIESVFAQVMRENMAGFVISLSSGKYLEETMEALRIRYVSSNEWTYDVAPWDPAELPLPYTRDLHIRVTGPEEEVILGLMEKISDIIRNADLYRHVYTDPSTRTAEEIVISLRDEIPEIIPHGRLTSSARFLLGGSSAIEMIEKGNTVDIRLSYPEHTVSSLDDFENFLFPYRGKGIPLKHFFDIEKRAGVQSILTVNGEESFNIYARMKTETPPSMREELEEQAGRLLDERLNLPAGYAVLFENTQEVVDENIRSLLTALIAGLALIYLVLGIQFNSLRIPLIILVTIPLGLTGVLFALYLFHSTISLNSLLGAILLGGVVVNNAIIFIDFFLQAVTEGMERYDALLKTAELRFAPIIITMMTTFLGMLPIAVGLGSGTNIIQPLGITVAGGLMVSTLFTLFMVPTILNLLKIGARKERIYD